MQKQTTQFAVQTQNGVVQKIGKSTIYQPKTNYEGGQTKWYEDKLKKKVLIMVAKKPRDFPECDCSKCEHKETCIHKDAYRRLPQEVGGLGLCKNLKK